MFVSAEAIGVLRQKSALDFNALSNTILLANSEIMLKSFTQEPDRPAVFLNNHTMFDYIAQCAGVDKYRVNPAIRLVTRLALAAHAADNTLKNVGNAILNDFTSFANRMAGTYRF